MPAPLYRRSPRRLLSGFVVWLTWVVLSGYVFHGRTRHDLRRLSPLEVLVRLASLAVVIVVGYWLVAVMPANVQFYLGTGVLVGASIGGLPLLVQTTVTKYLEFRQRGRRR